MGWLQDSFWNHVFKYAYPISFIGSIAYGVLAIVQTDASLIIANKNIVMGLNIFIGVCGLLAFAAWFNTDISAISDVTKYVDLDVTTTKSQVQKTS